MDAKDVSPREVATHRKPGLIRCPFTILVDTGESQPFTFVDIRSDADKNYQLFDVCTKRACLGRHPDSYGDYTIDGAFGFVAVERKAKEDVWGTILGWPTGYEHDRGLAGRRERFEVELANLNKICSLVIVEATLGTCLVEMPSWGVKPAELNAKIFNRSVLSYQQRFPRVQWMFCDTTRLAEVYTFRWLFRWWRLNMKPKRKKSVFGKGFDATSDWI